MSIQHFYSQTVADGTATSVVRPSDWNSVHNQILNMGGNTAGTSQISGADIVWAGGNNVTLSANGSTVTIVGPNTVAQTVQTQASGNIAGAGFTSTTTAGTAVVATHNSAGLSMGVPAYLTTAAQSNHSHNFATTTTNGAVIVVGTTNSAGATIGVPSFLTTAAATNVTSGRAGVGTTFAGTNATATLGVDTNGVALSLSVAGGGVINQTGPNIAVAGSTVTSGTVVFSNANGVSFGIAGQTLTASAAGGGGGGVTMSAYPEFPLAISSSSIVSGTSGAGSTTAALYMCPMMLDNPIAYREVEFIMSHGALSAGTGSCTVGYHLGIYTLNADTAFSLVTSYSGAAYISQNSATAQTVFTYWGSNSTVTNATTQTSGNISAAYMTAGLRDVKLADNLTDTLAAGTYYVAQCVTMRSSSVNIGASLMTGMYDPGITNHAYLGQSALSGGIGRYIGSVTSQITGAAGNTLSMSMPTSINTTALTMSVSNAGRWFRPRLYV